MSKSRIKKTRGKRTFLRESRWLKVYSFEREGRDPYITSESKLESGEVTITGQVIKAAWPAMGAMEKRDFVMAVFQTRPEKYDFDGVLKFLATTMPEESFVSKFGVMLPSLEDKEWAFNKLFQVYSNDTFKSRYFRSFGALGDERALPILHKELEKLIDHPGLWDEENTDIARSYINCLYGILKIKYEQRIFDLLTEFQGRPYPDERFSWDLQNDIREIKEKAFFGFLSLLRVGFVI